MRFIVSLAAFVVLAGLVLMACNSAERPNSTAPVAKVTPVATTTADGARRITTGELQSLLAKDQAVVIDVRNDASYKEAHIRGAKLIPAAEILNHIDELPRNKLIVTYCS